jgi:hypothetical protein
MVDSPVFPLMPDKEECSSYAMPASDASGGPPRCLVCSSARYRCMDVSPSRCNECTSLQRIVENARKPLQHKEQVRCIHKRLCAQ